MPAARPPSLIPQALLLLLPVVVLAVIGTVSLVRERRATFQEARDELRSSSQRLARKLASNLASFHGLPYDETTLLVDAQGSLVSPKPYPEIPQSGSGRSDLSPAGLPLAVLEALQSGDSSTAVEAAFDYPSAISQKVIGDFGKSRLPEWEEQESVRALYRTLRPGATPYWESDILIVSVPEERHFRIARFRKSDLAAFAAEIPVPEYADCHVTLHGVDLSGGIPPGIESFTSTVPLSRGERAQLTVSLALARPEIIAKTFRTRALWLGGTIAAAALAALLGFLSTRRAFLQLQQLNAEKDNFVSSVSHELRAPVASMQIMAESLEAGRVTAPTKRHEYYRLISDECRRLGSLVENVLDFSRLESGRKTFDFEDSDLAALAAATVKLMEPQAAKKGVVLKTQLTPATASVDPASVQRALINLLENAITHTPAKTTVTVGAEPGKLWVEDEGPGVPEAECEKIFERFYRSGSELTRETEGVGIGLSIVKSIALAHGGSISVTGNRFTLTFP